MSHVDPAYDRVDRPTLLLDGNRTRANIDRMAAVARRAGARFRPHFKTHQSAEVGEWFRAAGVSSITVSSVEMGEYFADAGWRDIMLSVPLNVRQLPAIDALAARVALGLLVDSQAAVSALARSVRHEATVWIDIDTGDHRTGVSADDVESIRALAGAIRAADRLRLAGLHVHDGQTYSARTVDEVESIYRRTVRTTGTIRERLVEDGHAPLEVSIGDTPTCSIVSDLSDVDEIRPGTFVTNDLVQYRIGACREADIALALACPVVSKNGARREIVIYGGAVHLSKDRICGPAGETIYGQAVLLADRGWGDLRPESVIARISQEVSVVRADEELFESTSIGDLVGILPVHACLTIAAMGVFRTLDGRRITTMAADHACVRRLPAA